uniref:Uncharacterized protein n=1 Tax=Loxodonta africana TaxID=9785 RepID=G3UIW6_LOXAF
LLLRYLDMISKELELLERTAEEQRQLQRDKEERQQREHTRRKLSLRRKIEEEWKEKEMLLLTKIGEDVKREARIEEQRRKSREERDRKKQALLEKKMAYHLQKMQEIGDRREEMGKNTFEYKGQDGTYFESSPKKKKSYDEGKSVRPAYKGVNVTYKICHFMICSNIHQSQNNSMHAIKKSATSVVCQPNVQGITIKQNNDAVITKKSSIFDDQGAINVSPQASAVSAQTSPT